MTVSADAGPAPTPVDLCVDARWIVPVEPEGVLAQHTLVVDGGRIVAIAPTASAQREYAPRERVSLPAHVLLPGLVNAHTHAAMALLRGIADDVALKVWLEQHIWPREARFVSPDFVHDGTLIAAGEMLLSGITCCADQYFFPDAAARAYRQSGIRAFIGLPVLDFPTPYAADAELLVAQSCQVVHCPSSNLKLASGIAPVARLKARGVNVALGSDGAASNNRLDVLGEARLAALLAKVATGDASALPASTALRMATLDGAAALGLDAEIGSLVRGKQADAIAVNLAAFQHAPCYDPVSHLVHVASREQVTEVWIAGKRMVSGGALLSLDAAELAAR